MVYNDSYLALKHPGLDPRNLFLTTKLTDIADDRAGKQAYWNNWPIATFEQDLITESIQAPLWDASISYIAGASGNIGMVNITSSTSQTFLGEKRYYISGNVEPDIYTGSYSVQFGYYSDNTPAILSDIGPSLNSNTVSSYNTQNNGKTGFIVSYSESGKVESILPFEGFSTEVQSICSSEDGLYLYASGTFDKFIEVGEFVWSAYENLSGPTGATGSPVGVTNSMVPGATSGIYAGIGVPSNGTVSFTSTWTISVGAADAVGSGRCDFGFSGITAGYGGNYEGINKVYLNFVDSTSVNRKSVISEILTGQTLIIQNTSYRINQIYMDTDSFGIGVTYQSGATGSVPYIGGTSMTIRSFDRYSTVYPYTLYNETSQPNSKAIFVAKIGRDLGNISSFAGVTGDYNSSVQKAYRINSFRHFVPTSAYPGGTAYTSIDSSKYHVNLTITHEASTPVTFDTLKNAWTRNDDLSTSPNIIGNSTDNIFGSYVKLDCDNLALSDVVNSTGTTGGFYISGIKSSVNESGILITGQSKGNLSMFGLDLFHPSPSDYSSYPFYILAGVTGNGITGGIINIGGTSASSNINKIHSAKDNSGYYVNTVIGDYGQGLTGSYFGSEIVLGSTGKNYLYTAEITDQGTVKNIFSNGTGVLDREMDIIYFDKLDDNQFISSYKVNTPGLTGYNVALLKTNNAGKNLDLENLGLFSGDITFVKDSGSNLFSSGINTSGTTGGTGSLVYFGATGGFSTLIEQYKPELGINLGNIISRPGSGAWTWCDVHSTDNYMEIPLLSTVVFNNYASNIYGKKNNKWVLSNPETGEELLNIKGSPYFIYTFVNPGYYTIYNQVEDSAGNVYEVSKAGFIKVTNHKDKRPDDVRPDFVDSSDYGYPNPPFLARDYRAMRLSKDLMYQEMEILKANQGQFGSAIVIPNNPDSTFNKE
jgi:hypothetical protein